MEVLIWYFKKKVEIIFVGGGGLKKEYYQIDSARGAVGPGYLLSQAQHNKNNPDSETEEIDPPKEPKERTLLERL